MVDWKRRSFEVKADQLQAQQAPRAVRLGETKSSPKVAYGCIWYMRVFYSMARTKDE